MESMSLKFVFTITAEILAYPLAIFYCYFIAMRQQVRADNLTICIVKSKLMSVFRASVLLLTMNFFITLSK